MTAQASRPESPRSAPASRAPDGAEPARRAPAKGRAPDAPRGLAAAATAFVIWGLFPLYFAPLERLPVLEIIAHRVVWSCLLVGALLYARREFGAVRAALADRRTLWRLSATATLISINWLAYVWGVTHGHVVETSLGYFINPLVNVLLGVAVLSERLNRTQWTAVALAGAAVAYLTIEVGAVPWLALVLAFSFGLYGLIRKVAHVEALPGLAVETVLLLPLALGYLLWCERAGTGAFGHGPRLLDLLLIGCGPVTALPLLLFAAGARKIPLSTVGLLQYISPTLQLVCGVLVFHEPFGRTRAAGFSLIWIALLIYAADGLVRARRDAPLALGAALPGEGDA